MIRWFHLIAIVALIGLVAWSLKNAHAHGDAQWIMDGRYTSPIDGTLCCGPTDCEPVKRVDVIEEPEGWRYIPTSELMPRRFVHKSIDARFWRCHDPLNWFKTKCFFVPFGNS